mmetsp:Transcript_56235/g.133544  ORF Transcript_56235/g.133544 Transcript_56235/m.133544 type:complete len:275 (+) Transcript_56235:703-1527(+)
MGHVSEVPLAARAVVRPVVADTGEVDPLGVAKLVAHEREVPLAAEGHGDHADHLVERDAAVDDGVGGGEDRHAFIHLLVHQPERHRLVADERLIVRLAVADHLLLVPAVGEGVDDVAHLPLVVRHLLEKLDPHVGGSHRETVVEAKPALRNRAAEGRHAGDVLRDRDAPGAQRVDEVVGEHEVHARLDVRREPEVLAITVDEAVADAVVLVQHRGDAVETEAIELVLLEPPFEVRKEEAKHLPAAVVVDAGVPLRVVALRTLLEVEAVGAVKLV